MQPETKAVVAAVVGEACGALAVMLAAVAGLTATWWLAIPCVVLVLTVWACVYVALRSMRQARQMTGHLGG
jgi:hypothetical protein